MSKQSTSLQRAARVYLSPCHFQFVKGYSALNETSESKVLSLAVKKLYEATPPQERERIKAAASKNSY